MKVFFQMKHVLSFLFEISFVSTVSINVLVDWVFLYKNKLPQIIRKTFIHSSEKKKWYKSSNNTTNNDFLHLSIYFGPLHNAWRWGIPAVLELGFPRSKKSCVDMQYFEPWDAGIGFV